jgi:hypothetical protein
MSKKKKYDNFDTFDDDYKDLELNVSLSDKTNNDKQKKKKKHNENNNNKNNDYDNPLCKFLKPNIVYDRDDVVNV